jgi:hypothetical protein
MEQPDTSTAHIQRSLQEMCKMQIMRDIAGPFACFFLKTTCWISFKFGTVANIYNSQGNFILISIGSI